MPTAGFRTMIAAAIFARTPVEVRRAHSRANRAVVRQYVASQMGPATPNKVDGATRAYVAMILRHRRHRGQLVMTGRP